MDLNEIQDLIKFVSKSGVSVVEIEKKDFKITIKSDPGLKKRRGRSDETSVTPVQVVSPVQPAVQPMVVSQPAPVAAPAPAPAPAQTPASGDAAESDDSKYITFKSPMIGTFYRSPGPDKDAFVNVGDDISKGKVICIIEAMKLFNEIESEIQGKIVKVLVDDATPVEYDQPLFLIDPGK